MRTKRWVLFIGLNIIVSILTTLGVLTLKGKWERVVVVTVTPVATPMTGIPTAAPVGQVSASTATPTAPPTIEYAVQAGDTLGGVSMLFDVPLADILLANNMTEDSIIQPGQVLVIPQGTVVTPTPITPSPTPITPTPVTPTAFPTDTPTPPGPVEVRIMELLAPGELDREGIVIINRGRTVNLQGWTLSASGESLTFTFPRLTLAQEVPVMVYTIAGDDSPQELHWGLGAAQWVENDTIIELRDAEGDLIATYTVP